MNKKVDLNKVNSSSADITQENIEKLKQLFPEIVEENKIDFDKLKTILGNSVDNDNEKYSFTWHGKKNAMKIAQATTTDTLKPNKEKSKEWNDTDNIYIEGDNLKVLKTLQKSYSDKIKMIYLDPPYNTGHDFIYHDNYKENQKDYYIKTNQTNIEGDSYKTNKESNGRFHTDWLNMMYPRIKLARNLLTDDGIVFISIDDNELQNVLELFNEIFGSNNFIGTVSVENNPKGRRNSSFISVSSEYLVIFAKNKDKSYFVENIPKHASSMEKDENGRYVHKSGKRVLVGDNKFNDYVSDYKSDKNYSVYYNNDISKIKLVKEEGVNHINEKYINQGYKRYFSSNNNKLILNTYTNKKFINLFENDALEFTDDKIFEKNFNDTIRIKSQLKNSKYDAIINGKKEKFNFDLTTTGAGTHLKKLFNLEKAPFTAPKNIGLLKFLITLFDDKNFTVLDLFSGSATTAAAILEQNKLDNGKRKFIMVQLPENLDENLKNANSSSKGSIKSAIKYLNEKNLDHDIPSLAEERIRLEGERLNDDKLDDGFKVFELSNSNIKEWDPNDNLDIQLENLNSNFKKSAKPLDIVYEIMLKQGLDLNYSVKKNEVGNSKVFDIANGAMFIVLGKEISSEASKYIVKKIKENKIDNPVVIFEDQGFINDSEKLNSIEQLNIAGVQSEDILSI